MVIDASVGGTEPASPAPVQVTFSGIRETVRTGLFTAESGGRLGWAHATFSEYLAAAWVAANALSEAQVRSLLVAADGRVFPQLREVAAWLVAIQPRRFSWMALADPEAFLGKLEVPGAELRSGIVEALFREAERGRLRHGFGTNYVTIKHPRLAAQILPRLRNDNDQVRKLAFDLARDCPSTELHADLVGISLGTELAIRDRVRAASALVALGRSSPVSELRTLALARDTQEDPQDELKGLALLASWPHALSVDEVFSVLVRPKKRATYGVYALFLNDFASSLTLAHLDPALEWLANNRDSLDDHRLGAVANAILRLALEAIDRPRAQEVLVDIVLERAARFDSPFADEFGEPDPLADDERRRSLAAAILARHPDLRHLHALTDAAGRGWKLFRAEDLAWLADRYKERADERPQLGQVFTLTFKMNSANQRSLVLSLTTDHPLYVDVVHQWVEPIDLVSPLAERLRQQWLLLAGKGRSRQGSPDGNSVNDQIKELLDKFDVGEVPAYGSASRLLSVPPGARHSSQEFEVDVTSLARWAALPDELRERFLQASAAYLAAGVLGASASSVDEGRFRETPAWAGFRALVLLLRLRPAEVAALPGETWKQWAPVLATWRATGNGATWEDKKRLLALALPYAAAELRATILAAVRGAVATGAPAYLGRELKALWSDELRDELLRLAQEDPADPPLSDIVEALVDNDPDATRSLIEGWLSETGRQANRLRALRVGRIALARDPLAWPCLYRALVDAPDFGKELFLGAGSMELTVPQLAADGLADLYLWLFECFPPSEDPLFDDVHPVGPREEVGHWRDKVLNALARAGTLEAVEGVRRIVQAMPGEKWLAVVLADAEEALRKGQWVPTTTQDLLHLGADRRSRLIHTAGHLVEVALEALDRIQQKIQGETPESHLLWDTRARMPKVEDEFSDYLSQKFRDDIGDRGIIINREVQVRRSKPSGIGERTDLRIDASAADPNFLGVPPVLCVPVEVKLAWNDDLLTAMGEQLVGRYMHDLNVKHGIYLLGWCDVDEWWSAEDPNRKKAAVLDKQELQDELLRQAQELQATGYTVSVVCLDLSYRRPEAG
jgi:hypothetical protein